MYCFVILLLFNEMQMSVRRFSAIPHLREDTLHKIDVSYTREILHDEALTTLELVKNKTSSIKNG